MKYLERDLKIRSTLNRDKQYLRIRIRTESASKMKEIIKSYLLPCFNYKLTMTP